MDDIASMSWIGLVLAIVAAYFAIKVVKFIFKMFFWVLVLAGAYWYFGPMIGLPFAVVMRPTASRNARAMPRIFASDATDAFR